MKIRYRGKEIAAEWNGDELFADGRPTGVVRNGRDLRRGGREVRAIAVRDRAGVWVWVPGWCGRLEFGATAGAAARPPSAGEVRAPMTGRIEAVRCAPGERVAAGAELVILTAMKMEYRLEAPVAGEVSEVRCRAGDLVDIGQVLVRIRPEGA